MRDPKLTGLPITYPGLCIDDLDGREGLPWITVDGTSYVLNHYRHDILKLKHELKTCYA